VEKSETKSAHRQKREQLVLKLQQQQREATEKAKERLERQQSKQERKQRKEAYAQMYQSQTEYLRIMEERSAPKRQQLSLPIYTVSSSSSPSPTEQSNGTFPEQWGQQLAAPTNDVYYHSSRYYHRSRPSHHSDALYPHQHLDSISTTSSSSSSHNIKAPDEKPRSLSLKSQSTKSMYDLRPSTGAPPPSHFDYYSGYDSDDTSMSRGWDSLMDTLHSPTIAPSPLESPGLDSFKDEADLDQVDSSLASLALSHDDSKNGNGKYLLGKFNQLSRCPLVVV
jgi:hypothetical protein